MQQPKNVRVFSRVRVFVQVFITVPLPIPVKKPVLNPWVYLYPCYALDKIHSSTGFSPFFANYGRHPYKGMNPRREVKSQSAKEFVELMEKIREETESALKRSQETMKKNYNKKKI